MRRLPRSIYVAAFLTLAYLVGLAYNITPFLRGPDEWRWAYAVPATPIRLWLPALLLIIYLFLAVWLIRRPSSRATTLAVLVAAVLMTPALQLALLYMDHPDVKSQLFYRTVSPSAGGYFNVGAVVTDTADFLRHFVEQMPSYPVHPQRHPPGLPLLFAFGRQLFDQAPGLAEKLNDVLRPYQCNNLPLMDLPDSSIASAVIQMSVPVLLGLVVWPLYQLGRKLYDENTARRAALLWPLIPSIALWATRWDQLFALFTVSAFLTLLYALSQRKLLGWWLSGLIVACALVFSFGNAVIIALLGLYVLTWFITTVNRPPVRWLVWGTASFAMSIVLPWLGLWLIYRFDPVAAWRTALDIHLGLDRSYVTWLFFHPYDFFVFLGIPIAVLWFVRTFDVLRHLRQRRQPVDVLAIAFVIGLLLLIVSGTSRGEVARVWAFLLPLPLLIALYRLPERPIVFTGLIGLLALQVFVSNIFLRPVGTGLADPPAPPPASASSTQGVTAQWQDGMTLQSAQVPQTVSIGEPIEISATWSTTQQIHKPYTLFVHVLNSQGKLLAQYDGMPLDNTWPTTCWQPGRSFDDTYRIPLPADMAPGIYQVQLGYYWLPNGERVPVSGPNARADGSIEAGTIEVK